ncbi:protein kinase, catalytic domain containing protein [Dorcoceras hygrometricum]|uniref:Protein kinase, catalytic domain containing protein n=1 Tax=Dorcoceras hygrometricum TaxID=472368 RepID=A0A2Z7CAZ9_9LAMI|nr:protein kinase, catalytic domain containing protein [Dorcoceras hygrometricum]
MGIDLLKFQSVQLGYLKILQLGNTDPNNKNRKRKYEVKPQNWSTRPANHLAVHLNRASILAQCINRGNHRSVIFRPVSHHISVVFRHNQSVGHHSDDRVGPFRHDTSVCRSQRGSISGHQSINLAQYILLRHGNSKIQNQLPPLVTSNTARTSLELKSRSLHGQEIALLSYHENTQIQLLCASPLTSIKPRNWYHLKEQLETSSAPPISLQTTVEIDGNQLEKGSNE